MSLSMPIGLGLHIYTLTIMCYPGYIDTLIHVWNVCFPDLYLKVGGELVLKPDKSTVPDSITSILWKHGKNKVAEWDKDFGGLDVYAAFKGRTTLDQTTGELRISGLMKTDSGVYSVEFNSKLLDKTYILSVISKCFCMCVCLACRSWWGKKSVRCMPA